MAAAGMIVLFLMIGGGIDVSRAYKTKSRLQTACDAAALAGRRAVTTNGFDNAAQARANSYFTTNFSDDEQQTHATSFEPVSPDNGRTVTGHAKTTLNNVVMSIFGFDSIDLTADCSATLGMGNVDVTMVLDTTGSMLDTVYGSTPTAGETSKLQDLQAAMKSFYASLAGASVGSNARIRYAFVPYTQTVNVGRLLLDRDPDFLADSRVYQSRESFSSVDAPTTSIGTTKSGSSFKYNGTAYPDEPSCISNLPANAAWSDSGSPSAPISKESSSGAYTYVDVSVRQQQTQRTYSCSNSGSSWFIYYQDSKRTVTTTTRTTYWMEYKRLPFPLDQYKRFQPVTTQTGSFGADVSSTWAGCILERQSTPAASFSFSSLTGISPSAPDLDIDSPPDSGDPNTQWAPLWPEVAYDRTTSSGSLTTVEPSNYGRSAYYACPRPAQLLTSMTQSEFNSYADSLTAGGYTYHDIGMVWAARISSPDGIWKDNVTAEPDNGATVSRHIIFMTDGTLDTDNALLSAWGIEFHDRNVTTNGSKTQSDARHASRLAALCEAVKAKGIRLWVVAFGTSLTSNLTTCASDQSAFTASSSAQLNSTFQEIAKQVGELRVTQ